MTQIELRSISKLYAGGVRAVDGVSLAIAPGEFFFLLGPSGCGKTTLLRIVAGLAAPSAGKVFLGGKDVTRLPAQKRGTAMVFQNYALWPHMSVAQNVRFGPRMKGLPRAERNRLAEENLSRVQMEAYSARRPNQLSGGQQQRVALARALAAEPKCLLLDEPLSNLDARLRLHMRGELRRLVKSAGITAIYVTHDQKEALSMADRIGVMDGGRLVQVGAPEDLYRHPASRFVADFLGEANFLEGRVVWPDPPARIETSAGVLRAAGTAPPAGEKVICCIRPEQIRIRMPGQTGDPSAERAAVLPATIESQMFLGETRQIVVLLGEEALPQDAPERPRESWKVTCFASAAGLEPGRRVELLVSAEDVAILPA